MTCATLLAVLGQPFSELDGDRTSLILDVTNAVGQADGACPT